MCVQFLSALAFFILCLLSGSANSQLTAEAGISFAERNVDGNWYQIGAPKWSTRMMGKSLSLGYQAGPLNLGYTYLVDYATDCICTPTDAAYDTMAHKIVDPSDGLTRFIGRGNVQGLHARWSVGSPWYGEVGVLAYVVPWTVDVRGWHPPGQSTQLSDFTVHGPRGMRIAPSIGGGFRAESFSIFGRAHFSVTSPGGDHVSVIHGTVVTLGVSYRF